MAFILESLIYVTAALNIRLSMKWLRRRSSFPMALADDATHADTSQAEPGTLCTRQHLPAPLHYVLSNTTSFASHSLALLRKSVKQYLLQLIPSLQFPH